MSTMEKKIQTQYENALREATRLNEARKMIMRLPSELRQVDFEWLTITVMKADNAGDSWRKIAIKITIDNYSDDAQWVTKELRKWLENNCLVAFDEKTKHYDYMTNQTHAFYVEGVLNAYGFDFDIKLESAPQPEDCVVVKKVETVTTTKYEALCTKNGENVKEVISS